jgi:hypothetical protein
MDRAFDHTGEDSSGATFKLTTENLPKVEAAGPVIAAFTPHKDGKFGLTVAEFEVKLTSSCSCPAWASSLLFYGLCFPYP